MLTRIPLPNWAASVIRVPLVFVCLLSLSLSGEAAAQAPALVEFVAGNSIQRGLRLISLGNETIIIGRDGWLHAIEDDPESSIRLLNGQYEPLSAPELRNHLRAEFGGTFEVIATQNFLVVQPRGRGSRWPESFEDCHRAFTNYMTKRGVRVRQGRFPMVAVVFPDSASMYQEFARLDIDVTRVAGLYSNSSNRVMTHDGGRRTVIAATVRHEAAHQSAFNAGVHSRLNETPQWIIEGIGQMFEPAAMSDPNGSSQLANRINRDSLRTLRRTYGDRDSSAFARDLSVLIRGDSLFNDPTRVRDAYALAWAAMFFLAERKPDVFADLLNYTAARPPFEAYSAGQRRLDFKRIVAPDMAEFTNELNWFLRSIE